MVYAFYFGIFILTLFLSSLQTEYRLNKTGILLGGAGAVLASPFLFCLSVLAVAIFQWGLLLVAGLLFAITKWKIFLLLKIKFLVVTILGATLTLPTGGLVWFVIAIIAIGMVFSAIRSWPSEIYSFMKNLLSRAAAIVRAVGDFFRRFLWWPGWVVATLIEFPLIVAIPTLGLWESFSWVDHSKNSLLSAGANVYSLASGGGAIVIDDFIKLAFCLVYGTWVYVQFLRGTAAQSITGFMFDAPDLVLPDVDGKA